MNKRLISIFWGVILILSGIWVLAENLGYVVQPVLEVWVVIFSILSVLFFVSYILSGIAQWGWLFPACLAASTAITLFISDRGLSENIIPTLFLSSVAIPFIVAFIINKSKNWWALIPAWVMLVSIMATTFDDTRNEELFVFFILISISLPFLVVYLVNRSRRWALIPFYILSVVSLIPWIEKQTSDEWIAGYILYAIALPFLAVFALDRSRKWALIPAFAMLVIGTIPILTTRTEGPLIAAFINLAISIPFLVVYVWNPKAWWALIPGGIMGSIAISLGILGVFGENSTTGVIVGGLIFMGSGATFGGLWMRRQTAPTEWAKYPAIGMGLFGVVMLSLGERMNDYWSVLFIIAGILLLYFSWREQSNKST